MMTSLSLVLFMVGMDGPTTDVGDSDSMFKTAVHAVIWRWTVRGKNTKIIKFHAFEENNVHFCSKLHDNEKRNEQTLLDNYAREIDQDIKV